MIRRRSFLRYAVIGTAATGAQGPIRIALARAPTEKRLVVVILRGALDGLAAVPPYADPDYRSVRGTLSLGAPGTQDGALDLDGRFGLHPALEPLHALYRQREMLVLHAVGSPYRGRSHFDGQDVLENGGARVRAAVDGWLNRALAVMGRGDGRLGLAVGQTVPLILRGSTPVASWAPRQAPELDGDFLVRLSALYSRDAVLGPAIAEGLKAQTMTDAVLGPEKSMGGNPQRGTGPIRAAVGAVGKLLASADGPRVAALDMGGWDTHSNQGTVTGRLAGPLRILGQAIADLKEAVGPAWPHTAVLVITEFGRTVAVNGSGGTDHGTGAAALLIGGAVEGGRVVAEWPGLGAGRLLDGRDLAPTLDLRAVEKALLRAHLGLPADAIDRVVFPESGGVRPSEGLLRRA